MSGRVGLARTAVFSPDRRYRYRLGRRWAGSASVTFVMLNPSTADAEVDDPTIRRCIDFARRWGYGGLEVVNLYAFRATRPADLWRAEDPVGPDNDDHLRAVFARSAMIIAAWGVEAAADRVEQVLAFAPPMLALALSRAGHPRHPLYVPGSATASEWTRARSMPRLRNSDSGRVVGAGMATGPAPRQLTDDTLSEILTGNTFGTLATIKSSGHPHLTTMVYNWDPSTRTVRFFTTADRVKIKHLRSNPRAALHVPGPDVWSFAVAEGTAEVSEVTQEPGDAIGQEIWAALPEQLRPDDQAAFFDSLVQERRVVIRLRVDRLYGAALDT